MKRLLFLMPQSSPCTRALDIVAGSPTAGHFYSYLVDWTVQTPGRPSCIPRLRRVRRSVVRPLTPEIRGGFFFPLRSQRTSKHIERSETRPVTLHTLASRRAVSSRAGEVFFHPFQSHITGIPSTVHLSLGKATNELEFPLVYLTIRKKAVGATTSPNKADLRGAIFALIHLIGG